MKKHEFNIFPDMSVEEFNRLKADIQANGFDDKLPIILYENAILDGWNRYRACEEVNKTPIFDQFEGTDEGALAFVMRSNKRRNITSEQWAILAVKSGTILESIQKQVEAVATERMLAGKSDPTTLVSRVKEDKNNRTTKAVVAERLNTTPKLLAAAINLKEECPEEFPEMADEILKSNTSIRKIKAGKKKAAALATKAESINVVINPPENKDDGDTAKELTDAEILQVVKRVRNEVLIIAKLITDCGMDNESIEMNQGHFEAIEKLQLDLGIMLTGFRKTEL